MRATSTHTFDSLRREGSDWVRGGETLVAYLPGNPADTEEAALNVGLVLRDLLKSETVDVNVTESQTIVSVDVNYTTVVEKVSAAIDNVVGHYRIEGAFWLSGSPRLIRSIEVV